jgi:S1-C subfamily serine protease
LAVALTPGHLVVTTAAAVQGRTAVELKMTGGKTVTGSVVTVDPASNTAVVAVHTDFTDPQFALSDQTGPVTSAKAVTPHDTKLDVWTDETGALVSSADQENPAESSIVVDTDGQLIGMCTRSETGAGLVRAGDMLSALTSAATLEMTRWLGATVQPGMDGKLTVTEVRAGGAAAAAGLTVGDVLQTADGTPITTFEAMRAQVTAKQPGDQLVLTVSRAATPPSTASTTTSTTTPLATSTTTGTTSPAPTTITVTVMLGARPFGQ